jgi:hypothetical protein
MLIAVHAAIGALIGENVPNPWWAFGLSFIFHFICDIIPHGDQEQVRYYKSKKRLNKIVSLVLVDATICIFFLANYFSDARGMITNFKPIIAGIIGGILPDMLVAFYHLNKKYFFRLNYVHHRTHQLFPVNLPFSVAFIGQMILLYIIWNLYQI